MLEEDEYSAAVTFFRRIMTRDDVLRLKILESRIQKAPAPAKHYLQRHCRDVHELEEFFMENLHLFFVENKRVALYDDELNAAAKSAVQYFREKLEEYEKPVHFMTLKAKHIEQASDAVGNFIARFYPGKEFKHFLQRRPDVFVLFRDHTVFLIEVDSVAYFKRRLKVIGREGLHFTNFRGHVGQAPAHVRTYINHNFPSADNFQEFLGRNSDVFHLDDDGIVTLVPLQ